MSSNRYYSSNEHYSSNGGYCNKTQIDHGLCGNSSNSFFSNTGSTSLHNGQSQDCYVGYGDAICTTADIQKATNVVNAFDDTSGIGNQIFALFAVLFSDVKFQCSADNIQGKCEAIKEKIDSLVFKGGIEGTLNKARMNKIAGILELKESKAELKSEGEKFVQKYLKTAYGFPGAPQSRGFVGFMFSKKDDTGIYYYPMNLTTGLSLSFRTEKLEHRMSSFFSSEENGYILQDDGHIKLDWSDELKKINDFFTPKAQTIYRVGSLTFFDPVSAAAYVRGISGPPSYELLSKTEFIL